MFLSEITPMLLISGLVGSVPSPPTSDTSPWAKEPEYFRAMEHGFCLDATQHHLHFFDRDKIKVLFQQNWYF